MGVPALGWVGDLRPEVSVADARCHVSVDLSSVVDVAGVSVNFVEGGWLEVAAEDHDGLRLKLPPGVEGAQCAVKLSRKKKRLTCTFPEPAEAWRTRDSLAEAEPRGGGGARGRGLGEEVDDEDADAADQGFEVVDERGGRGGGRRAGVAPGFLARNPGGLATRRDGSVREGVGVAAPAPIEGVVVAAAPLGRGAGATPLRALPRPPPLVKGPAEGLRVTVPKKKQRGRERRWARERGSADARDGVADGGGDAELESLAEACGEMLEARGWAAVDGFCGWEAVEGIRKEISSLRPLYTAGEIGVGVKAEGMVQIARSDVRGDEVLWVDYDSMDLLRLANLRRLSKAMDALVAALSRKVDRLSGVDVGMKSDCMLAVYPGGKARFQRHVDNTAGDGRRLTVLVYLNGKAWRKGSGGALRVHPEGTPRAVDLYPEGGRLAMFYADQVPHEVRPTDEERHALTVWYYDAEEKRRAMQSGPAMEGVNLQRDTKLLSPTEERSVRVFTEVLMGGRCSGPQLLGMLDKSLTPRAAEAVCVILGVKNVDDLRAAFGDMDAADTKALLSRLETMGLDDVPNDNDNDDDNDDGDGDGGDE